ncbi:hypothetical protein QE370_001108 [Aeromicrobium sp. SORGH_AS981]|uniref:hypothetical protein n=1 Tax=Aeromicrobium sp. SORGH_AS_0981 TaxID=3041802 RepID=UPI00285C8A28|nr:hypothetical protein [Aeromicrobium sp. SORGH_AS_0981]MDR6117924.1 hypothetical protein [Aeromicrobium sp. SORGH_AS_0981]
MRRLVLSLLLAPLLCLVGLAAPAAAAPVIQEFTVNGSSTDLTLQPDEELDIVWDVTSTETPTVTATGTGWSGTLDPSGTQRVAGPAAGESLTFGLETTDSTGTTSATTITVTAQDEPDGVTPPPVVVQGCTVVVPRSDSFDYGLAYFGDTEDTEPIEAGTYRASSLTFGGNIDVTIVAEPRADVTVADGAVTTWDVPSGEDCQSELFTVSTAPCSFTVRNITGTSIEFLYGDADAERADGQFTLAPGQQRTVKTPRAALLAVGLVGDAEEDPEFQILDVRVPQTGCDGGAVGAGGSAWPFPTNAPAAGVTVAEHDGTPAWLPVGLLVVLGVAAGAARGRASR